MKTLATYLYEVGQLKRVHRSGWWLVGIKNPETVAEHSFRVTIIAYILAHLEGVKDPAKILTMSLFHDVPEARINDLHGPGKIYNPNWGEVELAAMKAQNINLPPDLSSHLNQLFEELKDRSSLEAKIVRDADVLECLIQALEYQVQGYINCDKVVQYCFSVLLTDSGKQLAQSCMSTAPHEWWPK